MFVASGAGKAAATASRLLRRGGGGTVPGLVARRLVPDALAQLSRHRPVVLVSGTNGKTTTTALVAAALRTAGPLLTNEGGDNLLNGLVAALLKRTDDTTPALLEVDEAVLPVAMAQTRPAVLLLLNLSRDQLDRYAEVGRHVHRWSAALREQPATVVVANADDPLVAESVLRARPDSRAVVWVATGTTWRGDAPACPRCGNALPADRDYRCVVCTFTRPAPQWEVEGEVLRGPDGRQDELDLALPGRANRANAAMAVAAAAARGVPTPQALAAVAAVRAVAGRYAQVRHGDHDARLLLAKNPAGWVEALEVLGGRAPDVSAGVVVAINARVADGGDPSWLWDVPFEQLQGRRVVATGERRWDLAVRLEYADITHDVAPDIGSALALLPSGPCDVMANYTAFQQIRLQLAEGRRP